MKTPAPTRCAQCGTVAVEVICHLCKTPRAWYAAMRRGAIALAACVLSACTTIDVDRAPPADWPALDTRVHHVENVAIECAPYTAFGSIPFACAVIDFKANTCTIWTAVSWQFVMEHERRHCLGYDHPDESTLRDAWEAFKATK